MLKPHLVILNFLLILEYSMAPDNVFFKILPLNNVIDFAHNIPHYRSPISLKSSRALKFQASAYVFPNYLTKQIVLLKSTYILKLQTMFNYGRGTITAGIHNNDDDCNVEVIMQPTTALGQPNLPILSLVILSITDTTPLLILWKLRKFSIHPI